MRIVKQFTEREVDYQNFLNNIFTAKITFDGQEIAGFDYSEIVKEVLLQTDIKERFFVIYQEGVKEWVDWDNKEIMEEKIRKDFPTAEDHGKHRAVCYVISEAVKLLMFDRMKITMEFNGVQMVRASQILYYMCGQKYDNAGCRGDR